MGKKIVENKPAGKGPIPDSIRKGGVNDGVNARQTNNERPPPPKPTKKSGS